MLRSPIWWFGGKGNIVKWLLQYVPAHDYYLELFGGGAALLFAKPKSKFEVYNDIDDGLFTLFSVLKDPEKFKEFLRLAWLTPYSRNEYYYLREKYKKNDFKNDIEKAYTFWYIARTSFSGSFGQSMSLSVTEIRRNMPESVGNYLSTLKKLLLIHERIMTVQIECLDFRECLKKYVEMWDYKNSFVYADPPYVKSTRKSGEYRYEMTDEDHHDLVDLLIKYENKAKFMLSGYPNEIYEKLEKRGWKRITRTFGCFAIGRTRYTKLIGEESVKNNPSALRKESIWINYDVKEQLKMF